MKNALISPNEPVLTGYRVAQVSNVSFDVASPLFWVECADDVVADQFYYDPEMELLVAIPAPESMPITPIGGAPNVIA